MHDILIFGSLVSAIDVNVVVLAIARRWQVVFFIRLMRSYSSPFARPSSGTGLGARHQNAFVAAISGFIVQKLHDEATVGTGPFCWLILGGMKWIWNDVHLSGASERRVITWLSIWALAGSAGSGEDLRRPKPNFAELEIAISLHEEPNSEILPTSSTPEDSMFAVLAWGWGGSCDASFPSVWKQAVALEPLLLPHDPQFLTHCLRAAGHA
jgi:hypothetical protein